MEPTAAQFGHLFSWRHPATTMDLTHAAAYRYNQNMMEYYTCKSKLGAILFMEDMHRTLMILHHLLLAVVI